jgi:dimethylhistidine N-methyltransferase
MSRSGPLLPRPAPDAENPQLQRMREEIAKDLLRKQAQISPKYFYDVLGSKLFEAICELDEYYLTRTEAEIFQTFEVEIAKCCGSAVTLIDLGAGNCGKAARLFASLRPAQYVPIDISAEFLTHAILPLQARHPELDILPLGQDFSERLFLPAQVRRDRRLFFYPGSSIGNFSPLQALQFLKHVREACPGPEAGILIGVDLVKDPAELVAAYDDRLGVTAAFNRNILRHVNRILGTDFELANWKHHAAFNLEQGRIEMRLTALKDVRVEWNGGARAFAAGETIHTENSYKYSKERFLELLREAGFGNTACWSDDEARFLVCHALAV